MFVACQNNFNNGETQMSLLRKAVSAIFLFAAIGSASATVIGFDDLPTYPTNWNPPFNSGPIPPGYMGLNWEVEANDEQHRVVFSGTGWFPNISGATTTSGNNFISSYEGTIVFSMPDGRPFRFNGFSARSAVPDEVDPNGPVNWSAAIDVIANGVHSEYLRRDIWPLETYQRYDFNWMVTSVMFGLGGSMLIDDIEINGVPEPTSLALLAIGLLAASSFSRKRRLR
jgi:hypothetical protein